MITLTKDECFDLFKDIKKLIKTAQPGFFRFKKLKGAMGYCEWEDGILIDYRRELLPTLIHECIHFLRPDWSETLVLYAEKRVINTIDIKDIIDILYIFSCKVVVDVNYEKLQ